MMTTAITDIEAEAAAREARAERGGWLSRHGFEVVERRGDGTGYIELCRFHGTDAARGTAVAAIERVAGAGALVIDLRRNRGGDASMAALITSLLFDTEALDQHEVYAPGEALPRTAAEPRFARERLEILLSGDTHPLGVAFAANLDRLGRALVRLLPTLPPSTRAAAV